MRRESEFVEQVVKLAENYVDEEMTRGELLKAADKFCDQQPTHKETVLDTLAANPNKGGVQEVVASRTLLKFRR
jgi:hypothetical protein